MNLAGLLVLALASAEAPPALPAGTIVEKVACLTNPSFGYALYLPSAYTPERRWPALLVFDPGARAVKGAELFREAAERFGWIVLSSADTRSSGVTMQHNADAALAMLGDVERRWPVDRRRIYAAGFSGGATLAWLVGRQADQLAGVIASGGPYQEKVIPERVTYDHFGAAGIIDFNHRSMVRIDALLAAGGAAHRLELFDGRHEWMPASLAGEAVVWLELQAMRRGLRERDDALIASAYEADAARARELETAGQRLAAARRWWAIAETFAGLREDAPARAEAARLEALPDVARERKDEDKWYAWEDSFLAGMWPVIGRLAAAEEPPPAPLLAGDLDLPRLEKMAARPGLEGTTGRRLLEIVWSQLVVVLAPQLVNRGDYTRLVPTLTVAARIRPDNPLVLYNLACAYARVGGKRSALDALARAIDAGFRDRAQIESDPDLESLRGSKGYAELLARLADPAAAPATPSPPVP